LIDQTYIDQKQSKLEKKTMAVIKPFRGVLPPPEKAAEVAAVPYDVVNSEEAACLAEGNLLSFLRISRPEIEMESGIDLHDDRVYRKAAENFQRLIREAPLVQDEGEHLYVYTLTMGRHVQTGIIGQASALEYEADLIRKHEKTRKDKEDDRTRHVLTLRSHTGPVFLTYRDSESIDRSVESVRTSSPALYDFTATDGIRHQIWRVSKTESTEMSGFFSSSVPMLYIADGHHRAAAAARAARECRINNSLHTGSEAYNFFLAVAFPASQLQILPYNRIVFDLNGHAPDSFLRKVSERFHIEPSDSPSPTRPGDIRLYFRGEWKNIRFSGDLSKLDAVQRLDVSILQDNVLEPILGIDNPRTSKRIDFVGGIRGTRELEERVDSGKAVLAFSMYPTTVAQLMEIADTGGIMPPKSTWFEPKLRDGLVCDRF
jgi:uncharacterized protein (DUF1015 family)